MLVEFFSFKMPLTSHTNGQCTSKPFMTLSQFSHYLTIVISKELIYENYSHYYDTMYWENDARN
jgi:hypothetical protein